MSTTLIIIAVTAVISFLGFSNPNLVRQLILWPPALDRDRQYYRLVTYGLIHADPQHLLFNMLTLYFFGRVMEQLYDSYLGVLGFAIFYVGGLIVSILPTYLRNRNNPRYHSLGASGTVSAVLFAYILIQPWSTILVLFFPMPAIIYAVAYLAYTFYMDRQRVDNINHSAHLWGAAYGIIFTVAMEPRVIGLFLNTLAHPQFGPSR
jgi:membrane associated rhomboid family serine protease